MPFNMDEVVGAYDYDEYEDEVVGDDVLGASMLRRNPAAMGKLLSMMKRGRTIRLPPKPEWREQVAPGVQPPGIGLWPLPLTPLANDGVLDSTTDTIEWRGTPQKPFRGERLVIVTNRSAGAFNQVRIAVLTVGTTPQLADIGELAVEAFAPDAFGVRLKLDQATPGMLYRVIIRAVGVIPVGESIAISPQVLGHVIRG
jgi:hypothetical protein